MICTTPTGRQYLCDGSVPWTRNLLLTSVGWANSYYATDSYSADGATYSDEWGIAWHSVPYQTPFGIGHYTEMTGHPLADERRLMLTNHPIQTGPSCTPRPRR